MSRFGSKLPVCARIRPISRPWTRNSYLRSNSTVPGAATFDSFASHQRPVFWRPVLFCVGLSGGIYCGAAYYTNEDTRKWAKSLGEGAWWRAASPTSQEMQKARKFALHKELTSRLKEVVEETKSWPTMMRMYVQRAWITQAESRLNSTDGRRAATMLLALNTVVFIGWQIPILRTRMVAHWLHSPLSGKSYTLVTSAFSHQNLIHIGFNMFALVSFGSAAFDWLGAQQILNEDTVPESTYIYHAYAFYLLGGIFSSLVSHVVAARFRFPRIVAALSSPTASSATQAASAASILPSLGASGAIYATVTLSALALPDANVALVFLPWIQIPISAGVGGMVLFDMIGVVRGWRVFDHWAHLGGAAFGVLYFYYGPQIWDATRRRINLATTTKPNT